MNASALCSVHAPVCWGGTPTRLLFTHRPAKRPALRCPWCRRSAGLPLPVKQPAMGRVIWPAPEAQILATLFRDKQIKHGFKPSIQGRAERTVGCGRESETYGLSALGNQRGPGHGPKYWHSVIPLLSSQCRPWHGLVPRQPALAHNAWTHFSNSQGPFPAHSLDGPHWWGGRGREFMGKSHDTPSRLGASKQFSGLFYLLV